MDYYLNVYLRVFIQVYTKKEEKIPRQNKRREKILSLKNIGFKLFFTSLCLPLFTTKAKLKASWTKAASWVEPESLELGEKGDTKKGSANSSEVSV